MTRSVTSSVERSGDVIVDQNPDDDTKLEVRLRGEGVWLSQGQMVDLFQSSKSNVLEHIKHVFEEDTLEEATVAREFPTTAAGGKNYRVKHYDLDVIISVGFCVESLRGARHGEGVLQHAGSISNAAAVGRPEAEFDVYRQRMIDEPSAGEREYVGQLKRDERRAKGGGV